MRGSTAKQAVLFCRAVERQLDFAAFPCLIETCTLESLSSACSRHGVARIRIARAGGPTHLHASPSSRSMPSRTSHSVATQRPCPPVGVADAKWMQAVAGEMNLSETAYDLACHASGVCPECGTMAHQES